MSPEFIPETELERAFVQSANWDPDRLWRKIRIGLWKGEWEVSAGHLTRLAYIHARKLDEAYAGDAISSIIGLLDKLDLAQKHSLFKISQFVVQLLLDEEGDELTAPWVRELLQIMFQLFMTQGYRSIVIIDMLHRFQSIYGLGFEELQKIVEKSTERDDLFWPKRPEEKVPLPQYPEKVTTKKGSVPNDQTELQILHSELSELGDKYGVRSPQVANALVRLTEFVQQNKLLPAQMYVGELVRIVADESVEISNYDLRRIYSLTAKVLQDENLLPLAEDLQRTVFSRREKTLGYDMSMAVQLVRMMELWKATGRTGDGKAFCMDLLNRVSQVFEDEHIVVRQIRSAHERINSMNDSQETSAQEKQHVGSKTFEEPDEFVSMLSIVAMDHIRAGRNDAAQLVLQELLAYYFDCRSDEARRVGEMLWLVLETEISNIRPFIYKLIELSMIKAFDAHLKRRYFAHLMRLIQLMPGDKEIADVIDYTIQIGRTESIASENALANFWNLVGKAHKGSLADLIASAVLFEKPKKGNVAFCQRLEKLAKAGKFDEFLVALNQEKSPAERIPQPLLIKLAKLCLDGGACKPAKTTLYMVLPNLRRTYLTAVNELGEELSEIYTRYGEYQDALEVLEKLLVANSQTKDDVNRLFVRMADVYAASDKIFDAVALLYMAFSDIPEPHQEHWVEQEDMLTKIDFYLGGRFQHIDDIRKNPS